MVSQKKRTLLFLASILEVQCFFPFLCLEAMKPSKLKPNHFWAAGWCPGQVQITAGTKKVSRPGGEICCNLPDIFFVFGLGKWDEDFNTSFGSMHHFCWSSKSGQKLYVLSKSWIFFSHFLVGKKHEKLLLKIWKRPKYIGTSDRKYRPAWRKLDHEPYVLWAETFFPSP